MREQLNQYVQLLFAGADNCEDIKQEILQNTLDRYDDLVAEGKVPEAAYRLAISGIGDINEILGGSIPAEAEKNVPVQPASDEQDTPVKKMMRAVAIGMYILCPVPRFVLSEFGMSTLGICGLLGMVAVATVLIILGAKKDPEENHQEKAAAERPQSNLEKSIHDVVWAVGLVLYFIISFATGAWFITWILFPTIGAVQKLVNAIFDLKEATKNEK